MRRVAILMGVLGVAGSIGEASAGAGAVFVPPLRIDVGPATSQIDERPSFQAVLGLHWASVYPKGKARIDVGLGVVSITRPDPEPDARARAAAADQPLELVGGYAEVAARTAGNHWWRTWVAGRVESGRGSLDGEPHPYVGVAARVSTEAYLAGAASGGDALLLGVLAIGVYGEVAVRRYDELGDDVSASAGLSFRVPLIVAGS